MRFGWALAGALLLSAMGVSAEPVQELRVLSEHPVDGMRGGNLSGLAMCGSELYFADEAFLCGTGQEIIPIVQIDRLPVGDGTIGVQTRSMQKIYFETVRGLTPDRHGWLTPV